PSSRIAPPATAAAGESGAGAVVTSNVAWPAQTRYAVAGDSPVSVACASMTGAQSVGPSSASPYATCETPGGTATVAENAPAPAVGGGGAVVVGGDGGAVVVAGAALVVGGGAVVVGGAAVVVGGGTVVVVVGGGAVVVAGGAAWRPPPRTRRATATPIPSASPTAKSAIQTRERTRGQGYAPRVPSLRRELADGVLTVTLERPQARNALDRELLLDLSRLFRGLAGDATVRAVVLTGADPAFCAGLDLGALREDGFLELAAAPETNPFLAVRECAKPVI